MYMYIVNMELACRYGAYTSFEPEPYVVLLNNIIHSDVYSALDDLSGGR